MDWVNDGEVVDSLTLEASTFDRPVVLRAIAERVPNGATVAEVEEHADAILASDRVVRLDDDAYTTRQMLRLEAAILNTARRQIDADLGVADRALVDDELRRRALLGPDQAHMVRHLTSSGHGVDVVLGVAGAGKTTALECAHVLWGAGGHQTIGVALAARAAIELETRSGIPSCTLDSLLTALDRPDQDLPGRAVVVVDEAAMIDTRRLARLLTHTDRAGAKVVLVGDPHQLPEIGAGGAFAGLARTDLDRGPTVALPASYLRAGHLTYAYATTIHKAQGMTCDQTLVLANQALFREAGYTALSRGRKENRLYVVAPDLPDIDIGYGICGDSSHPLERLVSALEQSRAKHLAIEQLMHRLAVDPPTPGRGIHL